MSAVLKDIQPQAIAGGVRLEARGLHKRYGTRDVLRNTKLTIEPGQFIAIVGRSGCGPMPFRGSEIWRWRADDVCRSGPSTKYASRCCVDSTIRSVSPGISRCWMRGRRPR